MPRYSPFRSWFLRRRSSVLATRKRFLQAESLEDRIVPTTTFWDGGGDGVSWQDAVNWSGDVLPGSADDVVIAGAGSVTYSSGTSTVHSVSTDRTLQITGGSLTTGTLQVNTALSVDSSATLTVSTSTTNQGTISSAGTLNLGATLNNTGSIQVTAGTTTIGSGTTAWTNAGTIAMTGGTLNLAGSLTQSGLGTFQGAGTVNLTGTLTGDLLLNVDTGSWNLSGTLKNSEFTSAGGATLSLLNGATLDNVTLGSDVSSAGAPTITVKNGLALNGSRLTLNGGTTKFQGTQSISGTGEIVVNLTTAKLSSQYVANPTNVTIGSGITITVAGSVTMDGSTSNARFVNQGTINVSSGSILTLDDLDNQGLIIANGGNANLTGSTWTNTGTLQINAGLMTVGSSNRSFVNAGNIVVSGGVFYLDGIVTQSGLGNFSRNGGTVFAVGTLDGDWNFTSSTGSWTLGGTLKNGSYTASSGYELALGSGATLDNVTLFSAISVSSSSNSTYIQNGLTLAGGSFTAGSLKLKGTQSISGTGSIFFVDDSSDIRVEGGGSAATAAFVDIAAGITMQSTGTATFHARYTAYDRFTNHGQILMNSAGDSLSLSNFDNFGTITASAGTVSLLDLQTNSGEIVVNGGTVIVGKSGSTWSNVGTINVQAGILQLAGNLSQSNLETYTRTGGSVIVAGIFTGDMSLTAEIGSVSLTGTLKDSQYSATPGVQLSIDNGAIIDNVTLNSTVSTTNNASITVLNGLALNNVALNLYRATLWFSGTQSISGTGEIASVGSSGATIRSTISGSTLTIGGDILVHGTSNLTLSATSSTQIVNQGTVNADATGKTVTLGTGFHNAGNLIASLGNITLTNTFTQDSGQTIVHSGLTFGSNSMSIILNGGILEGDGTVRGNVTNGADVAPGIDGAGTLTIVGNYTQSSTGRLLVDLGGDLPGEYDQLVVTGTASLAGSIVVDLQDGFVPLIGSVYNVVTSASRTGLFTPVIDGEEADPISYSAAYSATTVSLTANGLSNVSANGPYTIAEGDSLQLSASTNIADPVYSWDVNGDGVFGDATGANPLLTWSDLQMLGINDGPNAATYNVRVQVTDVMMGVSVSAPTALLVQNTLPVASISGPTNVVTYFSNTYTLTASDPSSVDQAATFTFKIDWNGDGVNDQTVTGLSGMTVAHIFQTTGPQNIKVQAIDKDNGVGAYSSPFVVNSATANVTTTGPYTIAEDTNSLALSATALFDVNDGNTLYSWDLNGDGIFGDAVGATATITHTQFNALHLDGPAVKQIGVTAVNSLTGEFGSAITTLTIQNAPPVVSVVGPATSFITDVNDTLTLTVNVNDPSTIDQNASFRYQIDIDNNGIFEKDVTLSSTSYAYSFAQRLGDSTIRVLVTDKDGGESTVLFHHYASFLVTEGQSLTLIADRLGGSLYAPGWGTTNDWDLNGDGTDDVHGNTPIVSWLLLESLGITDGPSAFIVTQHKESSNSRVGPPLIVNEYFDAPVTVLNAPPTAGIAGPTSVQRGQSSAYTLSATDPSSADQAAGFTFAIDWDGNGTVDETTTGMSGMQIQHAFNSSGTTNIKVTATDKDGGVSDIASTTVAVLGYELIAGSLYWYGSQGNDHVQFEQLDPSTVRITETMINGLSVSQSWDVAGVTGIVNANCRQGSDLIDASSLTSISAFINGGDQDDSLIGGGANDTIWGGTGNDSIQGEGGDDNLYGEYAASSGLSLKMTSLGTDTIDGGDGADLIYGDGDGGEGAADVINGGNGDDTILGDGAEGSPNTAGDTIHGGAGVDRIKGDGTYGSADQIFGDAGDDFIDAAGGNDLVDGGDGNDILFGGDGAEGAPDTILGGDGNDILVGDGSASPVTSQKGGADSLDGGSGQDIIIAGIVLQTSTMTIDFLSIRAEWLSGHTFAQKIANISGTGGTGINGTNYLLPGVNTFDDKPTPTPTVVDHILGGSDEDWLIINETEDNAPDVSGGDVLTDLSIFPYA